MNNLCSASGFILVFTILFLSASVLLISLVINRVMAYRQVSRHWVEREQARELARGGIDLAIAKLANLDAAQAKEADEKKAKTSGAPSKPRDTNTTEEKPESKIIKLLSLLNRWHRYPLTTALDGIDAELSIYITSEEGKINLVQVFDLTKKKIINEPSLDGNKVLSIVDKALKRELKRRKIELPPLAKQVEKTMTDAKLKIDDVTQFFAEKALSSTVELFFPRPMTKTMTLTDLFTVTGDTPFVTPILFSPSIAAVLGLTLPTQAVLDALSEEAKEALTSIERQKSIVWEHVWNNALKELYNKEFNAIPEAMRALFGAKFEPKNFSVVSYAKVGDAEQMMVAILSKNETAEDGKPFGITKIYTM